MKQYENEKLRQEIKDLSIQNQNYNTLIKDIHKEDFISIEINTMNQKLLDFYSKRIELNIGIMKLKNSIIENNKLISSLFTGLLNINLN